MFAISVVNGVEEQRRKEAEQRRKDRKRRKADSRQTVSRKKNSSKDKKLIRVRNRDSVRDSRGEQFSRSMNEISITDRDEDFGKPFVSDRDLRQEETLDEVCFFVCFFLFSCFFNISDPQGCLVA